MVTLFSKEISENERRSSKGNQLKWRRRDVWYKADYAGYEGLAEYMTSQLLRFSNLPEDSYVLYRTEEIMYHDQRWTGCSSDNMLPEGWQMLTLERVFRNREGGSLYESVFRISETESRVRFLTEQAERMTGIDGFGVYLANMLTIDAFFLNEDRHMHNIAVLLDPEGKYHLCPFFDHGASLLSDTSLDYPADGSRDLYKMIDSVKSKTVSADFDEQLETVEALYGDTLQFCFTKKQVSALLEEEPHYDAKTKRRVEDILFDRMRKYKYLFRSV